MEAGGLTGDRNGSPRDGDVVSRGEIILHGHRVVYRSGGSGPVILLIHGITSTAATWERVIPKLARSHTVIAPDLLGHGESAKPRGDYSLGAYASAARDLLVALGHERATIVGHSLGGGIAMQLAYQFPERAERLVLVDSGGLGSEVSVLIRAATLPGASEVLPLLTSPQLLSAGRAVAEAVGRVGLRLGTDMAQIAAGHATLADRGAREAFVHTLRTIVDVRGQRVSATDRLYLARQLPFLIVWGERDSVIPVAHGRAAHELVPTSRLEVLSESGHFPQIDEPERFAEILSGFIAQTEAADVDWDRWRALLRQGAGAAGEHRPPVG